MKRQRTTSRGLTYMLALGGLILSMLAVTAAPAGAATTDVATFAQLQAAINTANTVAGADTINVTADITLTGALPEITTEIAVTGNGHTLDGASHFRILYNNAGKLSVSNLTFANGAADFGSAIDNYVGSTLNVSNSTFVGNAAVSAGGAILSYSGTTLTITNSTFSGNSAGSDGGAVRNDGAGTITNSTFVGNSATIGGAITGESGSSMTFRNTVIGANGGIPGSCGFNGSVTNGGGNISKDNSCNGQVADPLLDPAGLQANGSTGPKTVALLTGSPAINSIAPANCIVATDERGVARPVSTNCDAGAYEYNGAAPTIVVNPATLPNGTYGVPYSQTITASGSNGSYAFARTGVAAFPTGLSLTGAGSFAGTPTQVGGFSFAIGATDGSGFTGSRSYTVTIAKASTTTSITSDDPDPSAIGETVTIKYTVVPSATNAFTPTGNVTVSDGTQSCTATVAAGQCTIAFATLGTRTLTATYAGDDGFLTSSTTQTHTVANRAPTALGDGYSTNEDTALTVAAPGVLGNDSDPDSGDTLTAIPVELAVACRVVRAERERVVQLHAGGELQRAGLVHLQGARQPRRRLGHGHGVDHGRCR